VPSHIGRFQLRGEIGRGSNGVVYAATDPVLGREIAIKAIPLHAENPHWADVEAGFLQEAKLAAGLNHSAIVTVFDAGSTDAYAYIAMERLHGLDLHHWLARNRPMIPQSAAALMARVADAVHYAHRRGLIHRDLKPSNVFLGRDMRPKVLDFGIALARGQQVGEERRLMGTPNYMSPEQARGLELDARSDVFSLGAILYELLTGQRAFPGVAVEETLHKVISDEPPSPSELSEDVPALLSEIVMRALHKDPAVRYQSASQLRNDLAAFAGRPTAPVTIADGRAALRAEAVRHVPVALRRAALTIAHDPRWRPGRIAAVSGSLVLAAFFLLLQLQPGTPAPGDPAAPGSAGAVSPPGTGTNPNPAADPRAPEGGAPTTASSAHAAGGPGRAELPGGSNPARPGGSTPGRGASSAPSPQRPAARPRAPNRATSVAVPAATLPAATGTLALAISPWGEVFVDGTSAGVSPPLARLEVPSGPHVIEIRNDSAPAYSVRVEIVPGQALSVQHRF
jgi:serine/threonine-protein kinase